MFQNYLEIISENLSEEWKKLILSPPSFLFWGITALLVLINIGWDWKYLNGFFNEISLGQGVFLVVGGSLLIILSNAIVEWFQILFFRLLEGYYWNDTFISSKLTGRIKKELKDKEEQFYKDYNNLQGYDNLQRNQKNTESTEKNEIEDKIKLRKELIKLDDYLDNYPVDRDTLLPTRLGNLLRAAEEYPNIRYGLETFTVWPRLWMVLPDSARNLHNSVLEEVYKNTRIIIWSIGATVIWGILISLIFSNIRLNSLTPSIVLLVLLFLGGIMFVIGYLFFIYLLDGKKILNISFTTTCTVICTVIFTVIWGIALSLIFSMLYNNPLIYSKLLPLVVIIFLIGYLFIRYVLYEKLLDSASVYANLLRSTFDLYRFDLYKNLHLKLPAEYDTEEKIGEGLSKYLKRGVYTNVLAIASENEQD